MGSAVAKLNLSEGIPVKKLREELGDDVDDLLADATVDDAHGDEPTIPREDLLRWLASVPKDQTVAFSEVVRFDGLAKRAPLKQVRAAAADGTTIREMEEKMNQLDLKL